MGGIFDFLPRYTLKTVPNVFDAHFHYNIMFSSPDVHDDFSSNIKSLTQLTHVLMKNDHFLHVVWLS